MPRTLEICCEHLPGALAAQAGGADRIELCAGLDLDGLTPGPGLLTLVKRALSIPVFVLIRHRPGDFSYSSAEVGLLLEETRQAKALGADGIVSGALLPSGRIDRDATLRLLDAANPLPFTFHRAFDLTPDPVEALDELIAMGIPRVLSSGQEPSALQGKKCLAGLTAHAAGRIAVLAGGGIRPGNLPELLAVPGLSEFHASARKPVNMELAYAAKPGPGFRLPWSTTDAGTVRQLREILDTNQRTG